MNGVDRAIRVSTAAAVLGVAGIAAYVSYWHAYEVVRAHGESGVTARLEPATIDGLVYASSMVVLYAARHQLAAPALARWLLALGIVATLAANVAHGWSHGPVGAAVAAWPAASLVGRYELLLWLIRTAAAGTVAANQPPTSHAGQRAVWSLRCGSCQCPPRVPPCVRTGPTITFQRMARKPTAWLRSQERARPASQGPLEGGRSTGTRTR